MTRKIDIQSFIWCFVWHTNKRTPIKGNFRVGGFSPAASKSQPLGRTSSRPVRISPHLAENHSSTQHGTTVNKAGQSNAGVSGQDCRQPSLPSPAACVLPASDLFPRPESFKFVFVPLVCFAFRIPPSSFVCDVSVPAMCVPLASFFVCFPHALFMASLLCKLYFASFVNMCQQMPWILSSTFSLSCPFLLFNTSTLRSAPFSMKNVNRFIKCKVQAKPFSRPFSGQYSKFNLQNYN